MGKEFLVFGRVGKNILYILAGMIIGAKLFSDSLFGRVDIIILAVAFVLFIIESIYYLDFLIKELKSSKNKK